MKEKNPDRKFYYRIENGKRKKVYLRKKSDVPRKKSLYNIFSSKVSVYLKENNLHWSSFGDTYQGAISYLWSEYKVLFPDKVSLSSSEIKDSDYVVTVKSAIKKLFASVASNQDKLSSRVEDLDNMADSNWWEIDDLNDIKWSPRDRITFKFPDGYSDLLDTSNLDLRKSSDVNKLYGSMNRLIKHKERKSDLVDQGVPSSSDIFLEISFEYDEKEDRIDAILEIPMLPAYLDYEYRGKIPQMEESVLEPPEIEKKEDIEKAVEKDDQDKFILLEREKQKTLQLKKDLMQKEIDLIELYKSLGMSNEEIRKKLLG